MNIVELENVLDLQKRAYSLLLWTGKEASNLLDQQSLSSSSRCVHWLKHHLNEFPIDLRPAPAELDQFAMMFTSFFNTSFRLEGTGRSARLVRGRKFKDGRNRKYAQGRAAEAAGDLSRTAVASLAETEGIVVRDQFVSKILKDESLADSVGLWSYACELVRRSQFASQGPAVHHLWLELDQEKRKRLNAEEIWKARSILIQALKRKASPHEHQ